MGHVAGAKGRIRVSTIDLEEGKKRSQKCKSSWEFLKDEKLLLFKHEWLQWEQEGKVGGLRQKITGQKLADGFCWGSRDSLHPFFLRFRNLITESTSHRSWIRFILLDS